MTTTLLPLYVHPTVDPEAWSTVADRGGADVTAIVNVHNGPGAELEHAYATVTAALVAAGVRLLGYVDLAYGARPLADVLDDIISWSRYPVDGIFFDEVPATPHHAGPVGLVVRAAERAGMTQSVLNPGVPTDPLYYSMGATVCVFEGDWTDYQRWSGGGTRPGDGHLVHGVPAAQLPAAQRLLAMRGAGFGLVTHRRLPNPYDGLPACTPWNAATPNGSRPAVAQ